MTKTRVFLAALLATLLLALPAAASLRGPYPEGSVFMDGTLIGNNQQSPFCDPNGDGNTSDFPFRSRAEVRVVLLDRETGTFSWSIGRTRLQGSMTKFDFHKGHYVNEGVFASNDLTTGATSGVSSSLALLDELENGPSFGKSQELNAYVNIHTTVCPLGEVAAQFSATNVS